MAARLDPQQDERSRLAIKTTQLVKRLNCFALNEPDDAGNKVELDNSRLKAIEILLRKSLPDLSAVQMDTKIEATDTLAELMKRVAENGPNKP